MKKALLATIGLVGLALAGPATAADIPYKAPPPVRPACGWFGGFYVGGNVGSVYHDWTWNDRDAWAKNEVDLALPSTVSSAKSKFTGGVQVGYNWQTRCTVWGFEADWSWANLTQDKFNTDGQPGAALDRLFVSSQLKQYGTLRTRAGVVVDDVLLYATGGFAFARINHTATVVNILGGVNVAETFTEDQTRWGWTAGVGAEWNLPWFRNWSIKSEALYMKFNDKDSTFNSTLAVLNGNPATKRFDYQDAVWVGRVGVNWRFGGGGPGY